MRIRFGAVVLALGLVAAGAGEDGEIVNPFEVVAAFDNAAKVERWPGFDATSFPIAIYDGERTILMRHPNPPEEFQPLEGHEDVWSYSGKFQAMRWNSNADIGGERTATLLLTIEPGRSVEYEAHILYHEVFHLFSKPHHPSWRPNEMWRYSYPLDDLDNSRLLLLEEEALARAVESESEAGTASWAATAMAIRGERVVSLSDHHRTYETALELQEGTAVYMGRSTLDIADDTEGLREDRGPEGIRWRFYETGAAIAVLLDRLLPDWKSRLDAEPETTFVDLMDAALANRGATPAVFTDQEMAAVAGRAGAAIAGLEAARAALREDFSTRGQRVLVRLAAEGQRLEMGRFDPMAVEILDRGEALHAHQLTAEHPRGRISLNNPYFVRRSLDGVIALTVPAGNHPFLDGFLQVAVSGYAGEASVVVDGGSVSIEAEGLSLAFDGARVESNEEEIVVTVLAAEERGTQVIDSGKSQEVQS
jgi:hypothetical protein